MEEIRDMEGRLVCYGDAFTGKLEIAYKKQQIFMLLPVGGQIVITREGVMDNHRQKDELTVLCLQPAGCWEREEVHS